VSAIAGFVASGPPADFERPDFKSAAPLFNDAVLSREPETFEATEVATTESLTPEIDRLPDQASELISPQGEDELSETTTP